MFSNQLSNELIKAVEELSKDLEEKYKHLIMLAIFKGARLAEKYYEEDNPWQK